MDGMQRKLPLIAPEHTPYESKAQLLPRSLEEAIGHLRQSKVLRDGMGSAFVDYYCRIKDAEVERYQAETKAAADDREVSEWEHREYFDLL
jgi:glutamine synthetase